MIQSNVPPLKTIAPRTMAPPRTHFFKSFPNLFFALLAVTLAGVEVPVRVAVDDVLLLADDNSEAVDERACDAGLELNDVALD